MASKNQKSTFFQIGSQIVQNYPLTQRAYAEGHEIAIHSWSHSDLTTLTSQQVYAELAWGIYAIHAAIGQTPKRFRAPRGSINDEVRRVAAQLGLATIYWTSDSNDWQIGSNSLYTYDSVTEKAQEFEKSGDPIILLEHEVREVTIDVAKAVSEYVSAANRINCPISAAFGDSQRYQGTKLIWPVAGQSGFKASFNPITGRISYGTFIWLH